MLQTEDENSDVDMRDTGSGPVIPVELSNKVHRQLPTCGNRYCTLAISFVVTVANYDSCVCAKCIAYIVSSEELTVWEKMNIQNPKPT